MLRLPTSLLLFYDTKIVLFIGISNPNLLKEYVLFRSFFNKLHLLCIGNFTTFVYQLINKSKDYE